MNRTHREAAASIDATPLWNLEQRWKPFFQAASKADVEASMHGMAQGSQSPENTRRIATQTSKATDVFINLVKAKAVEVLESLIFYSVAKNGYHWSGVTQKQGYALDAAAEWALAYAEHEVITTHGGTFILHTTPAACLALLEMAKLAEERLVVADKIAWETVVERCLRPDELHDLAMDRWACMDGFLSSIVRHAYASGATDGTSPEAEAMRASAGAIAYAAAEKWEYECLGALVSTWEPEPPEKDGPTPV